MASHHLLTVWNPSYSESAMDAHLEILLQWADRRDREEAVADDVYVWWGKLRSQHRLQPLPHAKEVAAIQEQIEGGEETHLYLTDYRSLYVGHLQEITTEDVPADWAGELDHMPPYYEGRPADFWFLLGDLRRLVADDTVATIEELKQLRNTRYHGNPVSLYGGMVELPLIVTRADEKLWFAGTDSLTEGRLWAERDAEMRGETERMNSELRENLLGPAIWNVLEPATRTFLATAEAVYRSRRADPRFDFSGPAVSYAKAVETELNALLFPALRRQLERSKPAEREVRVDGWRLDLGGRVDHQTLGTLRALLQRDDIVQKCVRIAFQHDASWLLGELPTRLSVLGELRNPAAHSESTGRELVADARAEILGIGGEGLIVKIARARMRAR